MDSDRRATAGQVAAGHRADAARSPRRDERRGLLVLTFSLIAAIVFCDWATPPGIVVGIVLAIPIMLTSMLDDGSWILVAVLVSLIGKSIEVWSSAAPGIPLAVWLPNRILAYAAILASGVVARVLQRHRLAAERARDQALSARDTNRLLMTLLAHDLRSPLVLARDALAYVERATADGRAPDRDLLHESEERLTRNLDTIDRVLRIARADVEDEALLGDHSRRRPTRVREEIADEVASFVAEGAARGKRLVPALESLGERELLLDRLVLRQALGILIDNALRHAVPGTVRVEASSVGRELFVRVMDEGPGLSARRAQGDGSTGSGLGLQLCRALAARAGGSLVVDRDDGTGTSFLLRLPAGGMN